MDRSSLWVGGIAAAGIVFAPFFLRGSARGPLVGACPSVAAVDRHHLTWRGFAWSAVLPLAWVLLFYALLGHIYWSLGRWPRFGEALRDRFLDVHYQLAWEGGGILIMSLWLTPVVLVLCLTRRRWRPIAAYVVTYAAAVGLAIGGMCLAPHAFLNWWFD
jgi:hypothetical protein